MNAKTALDPTTIAEINAIPTEAKVSIILGAVALIAVFVHVFKFKAAVPFALAFGGIAYVDYTNSGVTLVGAFFAVLTIAVLWFGGHSKKSAAAKTPAPAPAPAPTGRKGRKAKAHA